MSDRWERVIPAFDVETAIASAKVIARGEGYRVKTLVRAALERSGDMPVRLPEYRVVLAVSRVPADA